MKRLIYIIICFLLLFTGGVARAQVSLNPSSLTWEAGNTQTKSVQVTSDGWWQADSTVVSNHFAVSPQTGPSGSYINVTPLSLNAGATAIDGGVEIFTSNDGTVLYLLHEAPSVPLSLDNDSPRWAWNDCSPRTVTVSASFPWTASLYGSGFTMERSGNTLTFTPTEGRNDTAVPRSATFSVSCGNAIASGDLYQSFAPYFGGLTSNTSYTQKTTFLTADGMSYTRDVSYYDGLGYPLQEVAVGASPQGGGSIITPIVYDNMRRGDATVYLPYVRSTGDAGLDSQSAALTAQAAFYYGFCGDTHPYSQKEYGTSPFGQVKSVQKEGDAWAAGNGHKATVVRTGYAVSDSVMKIRHVPHTQTSPARVVYDGTNQYAAGQLRRTRTTDEDGVTSDIFTDAFGRTVCARTWSGANATGTRSDTYYIRDHRDSVVLVLQPEGAATFKNRSNDTLVIADTPSHPNNDIYREYCFSYGYDALGNLISEHIPGGGTTERVYDARHRAVLETNDLMPATSGIRKYIRTIYDSLDRITQKSIVGTPVSLSDLRTQIRSGITMPPAIDITISEYGTFYEASYYGFGSNSVSGFTPDEVATAADHETVNIKGLLKSETIGQMPSADGTLPATGSPCITRNYYYDKFGRVIQIIESDIPGWTAKYSTRYDFVGRVVAKWEFHCAPDDNSGQSLLTEYSYDPRGRLLSISREVDGIELPDVNCSYDSLGRLTGKTFGNSMDTGYGTQAVQYDIHGWPTAISASYNGDDLFSETLRYASTQKPGTTARWDGNIAEASFTDGVGSHTYAYTYDGMSRLTDAKHYDGASNTVTNGSTERSISYDRNGNMTALARYDEVGTGTPLSFTFTGNRIAADTYDSMGNMTRNSRNGLLFSYNLANLPEQVAGTDGASLTYQYLGDGSKWRASANDGPSILYRGNFVYEDDGISPRISSVAWDEGRISYHYFTEAEDTLVVDIGEGEFVDSLVVEDGICDEWHVRDHLGSVRAIAGIGNYIVGVRELNTYLPFGTRIPGNLQAAGNRHRFGGKEEQRYGSFNLGLSDFGARYYDPYTCRWTTRDPMAGKYTSYSPYMYCAGNPIRFTDRDGFDWKDKVAGFAIGVVTDFVPGTSSLRDAYRPNSVSDYNNALEVSDKALITTGLAMIGAGGSMAAAGESVAATGGVLALSVVGAPEGGTVAVGGAGIAASGLLTAGVGVMLMANSARNSSEGYNRGGSKSTNQMKKEIEKGKAPDTVERVDQGRIKNEKPHVHFSDGSALNKDGTWKHQPKKGEGHTFTNKEKNFLLEYDWTVPK